MFLTTGAEQNFDTSNPNSVNKPSAFPIFSKEITEAHKNHEKICQLRRTAHPAKVNKLESQRMLRKITRESDLEHSRNLHDELLEVHIKDIGRVCQKLKKDTRRKS